MRNVELPLIYTGVKGADRKSKVEFVLDKMQIMHRKNHYPQQLSGGQQQRVAVARAVVIIRNLF
jgi:putative ABC transport system ATP-binding protein